MSKKKNKNKGNICIFLILYIFLKYQTTRDIIPVGKFDKNGFANPFDKLIST